jgi:hypothetical protein
MKQHFKNGQKDTRLNFDPKKILAVTHEIRKFKPVLVNESFTGEYTAADGIPEESLATRDELVTLMGEAVSGLANILRSHEDLLKNYAELYADGMQAHVLAQSIGVEAESLAEAFQSVVSRHRHALTVIHKMAEYGDHMDDAVRAAVQPAVAFAAHMERAGMKLEEAVGESKNEATLDSDTVPLPKQRE